MKLSLLVTYRARAHHLKTQIAWWTAQLDRVEGCEILLIEVDETASAWIAAAIHGTNIHYLHCPTSGVFHKTKALNLGLQHARGQFVAPFDVDLLPISDTLSHHVRIAERSTQLLVTGYRVMCDAETVEVNQIPDLLEQTSIAPEDQPTALWKHLIRRERFGVVPLFERDRLLSIGGWDEEFIGWGGEDQDVIERYLQTDRFLCRCPDLLYLHLFHNRDCQWTERSLIEHNRSHYYRKLASRQAQM